MPETQETIADITAEMRKISAEKYRLSSENGGAYGNPGVYHLDFAQFAHVISDRLEAANRRERGDCAKLRASLCDTLNAAFVVILRHGNATEEMGRLALCADNAKAALAEPPRNCDKYPTFNDAIRALADKRGWHDAKWDSERYCIFASWLYAPYEEGGNDGNE